MNYLTNYLIASNKQFYVGAMSGHLPKNLKIKQEEYQSTHSISDVYRTLTDGDFQRRLHGFAHFRVDYLDDLYATNALDTRFYYIVHQEKSNLSEIKIRKDLVEHWYEKQYRNVYVLVLNDLWGYELPVLDFANAYKIGNRFTTVKYVDCKKNKELNDVLKFNLINPEANNSYKDELKRRVYFQGIEENKKLDDYIVKSYGYIENASYAKYHTSPKIKEDIVVLSVSTGVTKQFKSLKEVSNFFCISYKTVKKHWKKNSSFTVKNKQFLFVRLDSNKESTPIGTDTESIDEIIASEYTLEQ